MSSTERPSSIGGIVAGVLGAGVLLIVVVGLLAAIAIPSMLQMGWRAKRAEVPSNVDGIRAAELAYAAAFDSYLGIPDPTPRPVTALDGAAVPWPDGGASSSSGGRRMARSGVPAGWSISETTSRSTA